MEISGTVVVAIPTLISLCSSVAGLSEIACCGVTAQPETQSTINPRVSIFFMILRAAYSNKNPGHIYLP